MLPSGVEIVGSWLVRLLETGSQPGSPATPAFLVSETSPLDLLRPIGRRRAAAARFVLMPRQVLARCPQAGRCELAVWAASRPQVKEISLRDGCLPRNDVRSDHNYEDDHIQIS